MNHSTQRINQMNIMKHTRGMSLMEILLAMVIFVFGMLALAHLQNNLTRSSTDANTRTVASNLGEEILETLRSFQRISTDPGGVLPAYADITSDSVDQTVSRGGLTYTVSGTVSDYYFSADRTAVSTSPPTGKLISDFKYVELDIEWTSGADFLIDEGQQITGDSMKTGKITLNEIIPSIPTLGAAKVAAEDDGALGGPPVDYTPGQKPEIVAISLKNNKFKESTTPLPEVIRSDEVIETWFDVITFSQDNSGAIFLRREEFVSVSCECTIRTPSGSGEDGFQATFWNGISYSEGKIVAKVYGEGARNQSQYCGTCCRDHHDSISGNGNADTRYRPERGSPNDYVKNGVFKGDHPHYNPDNSGTLVEVTKSGDTYMEACRLIRKDGFFRVAQDFKLETLNAFPQDYLDEDGEVDGYSAYVTTAVADHYDNGTSPLMDPASPFPASESTSPTTLPTSLNASTQQLRSRGIYVDRISSEAAIIVDCMAGGDGLLDTADDDTGDNCGAPGVTSVLEVLPFFDVQTTLLARWDETETDEPVDVSNEELKVDNAHSRGMAKLAGSKAGLSTVHSVIEEGNVGLIGTVPVEGGDPVYFTSDIYVSAGGDVTPPPPSGNPIVSGTINAAGGTGADPAVVQVLGYDATCSRPLNSTFSCEVTGPQPTVTVSGYSSSSKNLWACSSQLTPLDSNQGKTTGNWAKFELPSEGAENVTITIQKKSC